MKVTKKRGVIALVSAIVVGLAVAIPMVGAGVLASSGNGTPGAAAAAPSPQAIFTGSCNITRNSWASNDVTSAATTTSQTFVNVTGMSVAFLPHADCAEITFSAYSFAAESDALMFVRARINDVDCLPGEVQFSGDDDEDADGDWARSHSFTFVCRGFHPGLHASTALVQFRSFFGQLVFLHKPTMVVRYS
jgi:hypothetical protein